MSLSAQVLLYGPGQSVTPPDTQLAAGPAQLVEMDNSTMSVWSKSGSRLASADLNTLFPVPSGFSFTDPRLLYDAGSGRWFASGMSLDPTHDTQVYVAVSLTSDATAGWTTYTVANYLGTDADQPKLGVCDDKVTLSWITFQNSGSTFSGSRTTVLQKSQLLTSSPVQSAGFGPDLSLFSVSPSESLSSTTTEWLVSNKGGGVLAAIAITGTPAQSNVAAAEHDLAITSTTIPPNAIQPSGPQLDTDDDRILSAVWRGGMLWASANDGCAPPGEAVMRSCLRLVQVAAASSAAVPSVSQDFDVGQPGMYLHYPAVTLDGFGDLFVAFSASSSTLFGGAFAVDQLANAPNTLGSGVSIQPGRGTYKYDSSSVERWGDYSGAAVDPANPAEVWVTAEYAASSTNHADWGTATGRLAVWESLGGALSTAPDAASWATGRLDVFARGTDNSLLHRWYAGGWSGSESLGGVLASGPGVVAWGPGRLDVFVQGSDHALWHRWYAGGWSGWESLGGVLTSAPDAASWSSGRLDVFARGTDNAAWHRWFSGGWSAWESLGAMGVGDPSAVSWGPGRIDLFARGADNSLRHSWYWGAWSGVESLPGTLGSGPDATSAAAGSLDVFALAPDSSVMRKSFSGGWSGWQGLGGNWTSDPSATSQRNGSVDVFERGPDNGLWHAVLPPAGG
jgi:hypothetical protein